MNRYSLFFVLVACATAANLPCPFGWAPYLPTDECYKVWPSNNWNASVKVQVTFDDAALFCASLQAGLPIPRNHSHMDWMLRLMGKTSGSVVWLGIRDDPSNLKWPQVWRTAAGRDFNEFFEWDTKQGMPGPEPCIGLQAGGDLARRIPGGNNKMLTLDCFERMSVMCVKQRVPVSITAVNLTMMGTVQQVWRDPLTLHFYGRRIPVGTLVSLQTTNEHFSSGLPNQPTHCRNVKPLVGDSVYVRLNVSTKTLRHPACNGTCMIASASWPATTPFVRGAKYSACFFVPLPFANFKNAREFSQDFIPGVAIEFVQRRSEYLQDVCTRHQEDVNLFLGSHTNDRGRPIVRPYYFTSGVGP